MLLETAIVAWPIRLALVCYVIVLIRELWSTGRDSTDQANRLVWTIGCGLYLLHVLAAFHFVHRWSHAEAVVHVARQTEAFVGWSFGGGVYFNYLFTALWVADVVWWWWSPASHAARSRWLTGGLHVYLLFIAVNGAVVFASGWTRWLGIPLLVVLAILGARRMILPARQPLLGRSAS